MHVRSNRASLVARIRDTIAQQLNESAELDQLGDDDALDEAGLDSVVVIGVVSQLEREFAVSLADDSVFDATSINALADALAEAAAGSSGALDLRHRIR